MIDSKTKQRIVVQTHDQYGPYVTVSTYQDAGALEDALDDEYCVLYSIQVPAELRNEGGRQLFFGNAADAAKVQAILDEIEFSW
ncbi:hypothetical protein [Pseudoduganella armeniaca]|uniref:Uncharacterized protein n=1 Tax=Pseudoduganella armeniaca TaxID=2072590 RepID=A0A2R4C627_9BURK|nr:hypothetical protein [Pseudoduganella armeniaca]AVR95087.1 hypothetical protein C9I28_04650 [Pseudoduganella armeniaca]